MHRKLLSILMILMTSTLFAVGCDDDGDSKKSVGSPCDETTKCDGVCNTALPEGMCIKPCNETELCDETSTCLPFTADASYCVPVCTANSDCRDGYTCASGVCRPPVPLGGACEEVEDCMPCEDQTDCPEGKTVDCNENICSIPCSSMSECPETTYCGLSNEEYWCVAVDFEQGEGTFGETCAQGTCAEGFTCLETGADNIYSFCSKECVVDRDCPPTMLCADDGAGSSWCAKRENCDTCAMDGQCGFQTDYCVTSDPAVAEATYCSVKCDPDRSGTCPYDYTCMQSFFCADKNAWVADCSWCPTGTCEAGTTESYQCFKDYGACVGEGNLCEPCQGEDDCTVSGGTCLTLEGLNNYVCTMPCDSSPNGCPDNYMCIDSGTSGAQCVPRTGSCSEPSNGNETCRTCSQWADCVRGGCLPPDGNMNNATYCMDYCNSDADCGVYATCETLTIQDYNVSFDVCMPNTSVGTCSNWRHCDEECPDPLQTCAYNYCVDNDSL